jgi:hypothetical protein
MPLLLSSGPQGTTGVDLGNNAFWRLQLSVVMVDQTPALALVVRYPPGEPHNQVALLRVPVSVAQDPQEVVRIAEVGLDTGTRDGDMARLKEAFQLFRNNPRVPGQAVLQGAIEEGTKIVTAYWDIREWLFAGAKENLHIKLDTQELLGLP